MQEPCRCPTTCPCRAPTSHCPVVALKWATCLCDSGIPVEVRRFFIRRSLRSLRIRLHKVLEVSAELARQSRRFGLWLCARVDGQHAEICGISARQGREGGEANRPRTKLLLTVKAHPPFHSGSALALGQFCQKVKLFPGSATSRVLLAILCKGRLPHADQLGGSISILRMG